MKRTIVLLILDGWGIGQNDITNAIRAAAPQNFENLARHYPSSTLLAHGIAVGLPWETAGTGEAGHLTIGAGRTIYQTSVKIALAINDKSFFENPVLIAALQGAVKAKGTAHFVGSITAKAMNGSTERLRALIALADRIGISRVRVHMLLGSTDGNQRSALTAMKTVPWSDTVKLASIIGRHYATDADRIGEKIGAAKNAILGIDMKTDDPESYLHDFYLNGLRDEFTEPAAIGPDPRGVEANDAVIFFDCDGTALKNLVLRIKEDADTPKGVSITTLSDYGTLGAASVVFTDDRPKKTLGSVLAENNKIQFRIAETVRYPHVTYFMNGRTDAPLKNEYRILVPSENVARKDDRPEMMTKEVADRGIAAIEEGADFVVMNFAAPDVMAHTGNFEATKKAVLVADRELGNIARAVLARNGALIVTADHGNAERMRDPVTGAPETGHNANPVPVILVAAEFEKPIGADVPSYEGTVGLLSDIAPTVLALMGIEKPKEMTGSNLIGKLI
ncbi:MAG: phosphoglycerate mutase (2,3-diphosphoglycerate-independent) [Candidatus Pacebacteria bacterium]|nr:phosphoglycerate mutase (2,3-diphosphoglycerate-independent) [Candidatus Paceibacterota bacterium]